LGCVTRSKYPTPMGRPALGTAARRPSKPKVSAAHLKPETCSLMPSDDRREELCN
jgi:hypothetical protein